MRALKARLVAVTVWIMSFVLFLPLSVYNRTNKKRRTLPDIDTHQKQHSIEYASVNSFGMFNTVSYGAWKLFRLDRYYPAELTAPLARLGISLKIRNQVRSNLCAS